MGTVLLGNFQSKDLMLLLQLLLLMLLVLVLLLLLLLVVVLLLFREILSVSFVLLPWLSAMWCFRSRSPW